MTCSSLLELGAHYLSHGKMERTTLKFSTLWEFPPLGSPLSAFTPSCPLTPGMQRSVRMPGLDL